MKIFDFRLRPPYKSFKNLGIYTPACNQTAPHKHHAEHSKAAEEKDLDQFWKEMEAAGIARGVIIGRQVPDDTASVSNDDIHDMALEFPDKIIPFGSLDVSIGVSATLDELERCIQFGFKGIAMEPAYCQPPRYADANVVYPIYARCEKAGIPVVLAMSMFQGNLDYSNPVAPQHVAQDFPDLQIVLAHACYPWLIQVVNLCLVQPNIWMLPDLYMLNPDAPGNQMYGEAMRWLDGERILYGSAFPCYSMVQAIKDLDRFDFSDAHKEKFFYKNAEKLLGMKLF